jgi:hypothetical protein
MNSKILSFLGLILVMLLFSAQNTYAQNDKTVKKGVTAADQKAIAELFKGVDQSKYRLQFNNKATTLGKRAVKMTDVEQVRKITNPGEAAGWIVFVVEGDDVIYVLAVGSSDLVSVLGKEKTLKLNQIMAKYQTR